MSSSWITGFMGTASSLSAAAKTAAAAEWTCPSGRSRRLDLEHLDGSDDVVTFFQTVRDLGKSAVADAGLHAHRLRLNHRLAATGRGVGCQHINRPRRRLGGAWTRTTARA